MTKLAIVGCADFATRVAACAEAAGHEVAGFLSVPGEELDGIADDWVLGPVADALAFVERNEFQGVVVGIGPERPSFRWTCFERLIRSVPLASVAHPTAMVDPSAEVGEGAVFFAGCIVAAGTTVGQNAVLGTGCVIDRGAAVGPNTFVGTGAILGEGAVTGPGCNLGEGSTLKAGVALGPGIVTAPGAVVIRDTVEPGTYEGVPAHRVT